VIKSYFRGSFLKKINKQSLTMKQIVLSLGVLAFVATQAQNVKSSIKDPSLKRSYYTHEGVPTNHAPKLSAPVSAPQSSAGRAVNSVVIGVAGNLYTALNEGTKPLYADDSISAVTFIHRGLNQANILDNKGQYMFDVSKDKGASWSLNIGPLNPAAQYVGTPSARFPQAAIFRPNNTLVADSSYLAYTGTWLDYNTSGSADEEWNGEYRGVGRLDGAPSTFTESADLINGGYVITGQSMTQSQNGVFWNLQLNYRNVPNSSGGTSAVRDSLIVMKGVWNATTKTVDWTETQLAHGAVLDDASGTGNESTLITDFDIAFDPTGQYGWIALKGDFTADNQYTFDPVFFKSTDGGATWSAPIKINLTSIQQIAYNLNTDVSNVATTSGSSDLAVDAYGNPHYLIAVLNGAEDDGSGTNKYNIYPNAGTGLYDLTFDPAAGNGCNWKAIFVDEVISVLSGDICLDEQGGAAIDLDLRANISRSTDGTKLFFSWLDTDLISGENPDPSDNFLKNISPNLFGKGLDLVSNKLTPTKNFTDGDAQFGGNRVGSFGGALFPAVSPTVLTNGNTFNVPVVLAEVDFQSSAPQVAQRFGVNPARFHYIQSVSFASTEFTDSLTDVLPPVITLNDSAVLTLLVGTPYTEHGATAVDCNDGQVQVTFSNNVDVNTTGEYQATYIAVDAAGNADTVVRTVIVGRVPEARFAYTIQYLPNSTRVNCTDQSLFTPTNWHWVFTGGSPGSSNAKNASGTYFTSGQKCIKLTAENAFGSDDTTICVDLTVGIDEVVFNESFKVYPNPSKGLIHVSVLGLDNEDLTVSLMNILGEEVLPASTQLVNGEGFLTIDASTLQSGSYFVKIQAANASAVRKVTLVK
jgi:hypothetical protein